jgi:hypothetical protein
VQRLPAHLAGLVGGLLVGCAGSFLQAVVVDAGPVALPVGLVAALTLTAYAVLRCGQLAGSRGGALMALAGWLIAVIAVSLPTSEGDVVLPNATRSLVWLYGGTVTAAACVLPAHARRPAADSGRAGSVGR